MRVRPLRTGKVNNIIFSHANIYFRKTHGVTAASKMPIRTNDAVNITELAGDAVATF